MNNTKTRIFYTKHYIKSCDFCAAQEGRHYCLLLGAPVKNMDVKRCKNWADKDVFGMRIVMTGFYEQRH